MNYVIFYNIILSESLLIITGVVQDPSS